MSYPEYTVCKHQALKDEYKDLVAEFGDSKRLTRLQSRIGCMFGIPAGPAKDKQFADVVMKLEYTRRDLRALRAEELRSTDIHPQVPMKGHGRLSRDPSLERDHLKRGRGTDPGRRHRDTRSPSISIMQPSEHQRLRLYDRQASAGGELEPRDRLEVQRLERVWQMELQRVEEERAQRERLVKDRNDQLIAEQRRRAEQSRIEHEQAEQERLQREREAAALIERKKLEEREEKRELLLRDIYMLKGHMACERDGDEEAGKMAVMMLDVLAQETSPFAVEWKALNLGLIEFLKYKKRSSAWAAKVVDRLLELTVAIGGAHKGAEELEVARKLYDELVVIMREEPVDTYGVTGSALIWDQVAAWIDSKEYKKIKQTMDEASAIVNTKRAEITQLSARLREMEILRDEALLWEENEVAFQIWEMSGEIFEILRASIDKRQQLISQIEQCFAKWAEALHEGDKQEFSKCTGDTHKVIAELLDVVEESGAVTTSGA